MSCDLVKNNQNRGQMRNNVPPDPRGDYWISWMYWKFASFCHPYVTPDPLSLTFKFVRLMQWLLQMVWHLCSTANMLEIYDGSRFAPEHCKMCLWCFSLHICFLTFSQLASKLNLPDKEGWKCKKHQEQEILPNLTFHVRYSHSHAPYSVCSLTPTPT